MDDGIVEVAIAATAQVLETDASAALLGGDLGVVEAVRVRGGAARREEIAPAVVDAELDLGARGEAAESDGIGVVVGADVGLGLESSVE